MNLENKTIVITGASGGIGEAIAQQLSLQSAKLILVGRNVARLNRFNEENGSQHEVVGADLATADGRNKVVQICKARHQLDILINVAGISDFSNFEDTTEATLTKLMNINLISPILLTQQLLPILATAKKSIILNVGSTFGGIGFPGFTNYCASKFGLRGFTEALKRELQDTETKVFYIAPRATNTKINSNEVNLLNKDLGTKTDDPNIVANAVIKQLIKETARVAIGWPEKFFLKINGLFPSIVDNAISKQLKQIKQFTPLKKTH